MKKTNLSIITILTMVLMFVFASCTKDGVYKPKKKISKIYVTVQTDLSNNQKMLKETWTWDGKLLSQIAYPDGDVAHFTYKKSQLTTITNGDCRTELTYDSKNKFIDNIKVYFDDKLYSTTTFQHEKKLITSYKVEFTGEEADKAKCARLIENIFRFIAPEIAQNEVANYVKAIERKSKGDESYTVNLVYDDKNITEQTVKFDNTQNVFTYTYTEYLNPFYGLLTEMEFSKNVPATCVLATNERPDFNYSYTYVVDDKYPTAVTETLHWELAGGSMGYNETTLTEYEYVK